MWGLLLFLFCYVGIFAGSLRFTRKNRLRSMWISAYLFTALFVYLSTEILSVCHFLNRTGALIAWGALSVVIAAFLCTKSVRQSWRTFLRHHPATLLWRCVWRNKFFTLALGWFLLITFLGAILYAPNTNDAVTYHLTRIMHWLQNENVSYLTKTNDLRMNYQLPLAEYLIMHIQLLLTRDYLANLVQWNAFLTTLIAASLIASELNMKRKTQLFASFVTAMVPNIIFLSQSTHNDLTVASFLLLFVLFMLKLRRKVAWSTIVLAGLSMGLALATKGTAFLYIGILGALFALWILLTSGKLWLKNGLKCSTAALIGLALLTPVFHRNYQYFHTILPSNPENFQKPIYLVSDRAPSELVRTFVRSMSLHLGTPSAQWNNTLENFLEWLFGPKYLTTQNINKQTTSEEITPKIKFMLEETAIGNLLHLVLFLLTSAILFFAMIYHRKSGPAKEPRKDAAIFTAIAFLTMIFVFTILNFSPWRARYHVPLFCLFSIVIAYCIHDWMIRFFCDLFHIIRRLIEVASRHISSVICGIFCLLLLGNGLYFLYNNGKHPISWSGLTGLSVEKLKRQKNEHFTGRNTFDSLNRLKEFLQSRQIKEIMFDNIGNRGDYPVFKFLGTPIQKNGVRVKWVDCHTKEIEKSHIPYLLLVSWAWSSLRSRTWPELNYEIIYSDNDILLFDLRRKVDNSISLPLEHSFAKYSPKFSFDGVYEQVAPHPYFGSRASIRFSLKEEAKHDVWVYLNANVTPVPGQYHYRFFFQGKPLRDFLVPGGGSFDFKVVLPQKLLGKNKKVKLEIVADDVPSPAQAKLSGDTRIITLWLRKMILAYLDPDTNMPILPIEKPQATIDLVRDGDSYRLLEGFSKVEKSGVWTSGKSAVLQIAIPQSLRGRPLFGKISGFVFLYRDKIKRQSVQIFARGKLLAEKEFSYPDAASPIYFAVPPEISRDETIFLTFALPDAVSPKSLGISPDARELGYHLQSLQVADKQAELLSATTPQSANDSANMPILPIKKPQAVIDLVRDTDSYRLLEGFAELESSGVWTSGKRAVLQIAVPQSLRSRPLFGKISGFACLHRDKIKRQSAQIFARGKLLAEKVFSYPDAASPIYFTLPPEISRDETIILTFVLPDAVSPKSLGINSDARELGYHLQSLQLTDKRNEPLSAESRK